MSLHVTEPPTVARVPVCYDIGGALRPLLLKPGALIQFAACKNEGAAPLNNTNSHLFLASLLTFGIPKLTDVFYTYIITSKAQLIKLSVSSMDSDSF